MARVENEFRFSGFVGADPEIRYLPTSGDPVATVSLGVAHVYRKDNERVEKTDWMPVTFFGKLAEVVKDHVKKGRELHVMGEVRKRVVEGKSDTPDVYFSFVATRMRFGAKPKDAPADNLEGESFTGEPPASDAV